MAPHSSTLAWKIPWMEKPGRLQFMGHLESDTTERLHFHFSLSRVGEGNGNPLQCSCLENPRDGGAWWAAIYGAAQSRTQLKQLSSSSSMLNFRVLLLSTCKDGNSSVDIQALLVCFLCIVVYGYNPWVAYSQTQCTCILYEMSLLQDSLPAFPLKNQYQHD